jgi:hypothetical protein
MLLRAFSMRSLARPGADYSKITSLNSSCIITYKNRRTQSQTPNLRHRVIITDTRTCTYNPVLDVALGKTQPRDANRYDDLCCSALLKEKKRGSRALEMCPKTTRQEGSSKKRLPCFSYSLKLNYQAFFKATNSTTADGYWIWRKVQECLLGWNPRVFIMVWRSQCAVSSVDYDANGDGGAWLQEFDTRKDGGRGLPACKKKSVSNGMYHRKTLVSALLEN